MLNYAPTLLFSALLSFSSNQAGQRALSLGAMLFGDDEKIEKIHDLAGTDYKLSHKYTRRRSAAGGSRSHASSCRGVRHEHFRAAAQTPSGIPAPPRDGCARTDAPPRLEPFPGAAEVP